jgi:hypothetical protein
VLIISKLITIESPIYCAIERAIGLEHAESSGVNHDASISLSKSGQYPKEFAKRNSYTEFAKLDLVFRSDDLA